MNAPIFLGIDLAWRSAHRTGLAVVDDAGALLDSGVAVLDDDVVAWVLAQPGSVVVSAVDAPLVVPESTRGQGRREGEAELARAYARYWATPYPTSRRQAQFDPPRAEVLARRLGWGMDPAFRGSVEQPVCVEVYPHAAMVALFALGRRIRYKKGPDRAEGFTELFAHLESLGQLRLGTNRRWAELRGFVADPQPGDLDRIEDEVDAVLCAHLAWLWHHRPGTLRVYGSLEQGYVVAPPEPAHPAGPGAPATRRRG